MNIDHYRTQLIERLKSGNVSEAAWQEIGNHLLAAGEEVQPLLLDIEMGLAARCAECDSRVWLHEPDLHLGCPECGAKFWRRKVVDDGGNQNENENGGTE